MTKSSSWVEKRMVSCLKFVKISTSTMDLTGDLKLLNRNLNRRFRLRFNIDIEPAVRAAVQQKN